MKLIAENFHVISKSVKDALLERDEKFICDFIKRQSLNNPDWIDLNVGPMRGGFENVLSWVVALAQKVCDIPFSLDTTNISGLKRGLELIDDPSQSILNSASAQKQRLEAFLELASEYSSYLIGLTLNDELGIPKEADRRLELGFEIVERANDNGIQNRKILLDPLVLPICFEQSQAIESLNTISMIAQSFEPEVKTIIGLSNISNGCEKYLRSRINLVYLVLAMGCGLSSAIVDIFDLELLRVVKMIESGKPEKSFDNLLLRLYYMMQNFEDLNDIEYDLGDKDQVKIYKIAQVLLNKKIYSSSWIEN